MMQYLIVCPLVFLAGFIDSIAGGGGLISLPAFLIAGVPPHMALGTNKLCSTLGTTVSASRYIRNGYMKGIGKLGILASLAALTGSPIGAGLSLLIPESVIKNMMLVVLPVVAFYVLRNKTMGEDVEREPLSEKQTLMVVVAAAFLVGAYDGFYGPGTGTFLILIMTGAARMNLQKASGLTKVINLSSNVAALITFIINGKVWYSLGLAGAVFCIAGHYLGSGMVMHNGKKIVRPMVLTVLAILFVKIVI